MKNKTKNIALAGIFSSLVFLLSMTPIGLIPLGFINLTIVHIPVIIGTLILGKNMGLILGAAFGIASTLAGFGMSLAAQSSLAALLLSYSPFAVIFMSIVPRLLIPLTTHYTSKYLQSVASKSQYSRSKLSGNKIVAISAVVGSLTNTVFYLGIMGICFALAGIWGNFTIILSFTMVIAASCEAAVAAFIAVPVVRTIKSFRQESSYSSFSPASEKEELPKAIVIPVSSEEKKSESVITAQPVQKESPFVEGVEVTNVAVLPTTDSFLPAHMSAKSELIMKKSNEYLSNNAYVLADALFDKFIASFEDEQLKSKVKCYCVLRMIENARYKSALIRLIAFLKECGDSLDDSMKSSVIGMLNIIQKAEFGMQLMHTEETNTNERIYKKAVSYIEGNAPALAAQMLDMYAKKSAL